MSDVKNRLKYSSVDGKSFLKGILTAEAVCLLCLIIDFAQNIDKIVPYVHEKLQDPTIQQKIIDDVTFFGYDSSLVMDVITFRGNQIARDFVGQSNDYNFQLNPFFKPDSLNIDGNPNFEKFLFNAVINNTKMELKTKIPSITPQERVRSITRDIDRGKITRKGQVDSLSTGKTEEISFNQMGKKGFAIFAGYTDKGEGRRAFNTQRKNAHRVPNAPRYHLRA